MVKRKTTRKKATKKRTVYYGKVWVRRKKYDILLTPGELKRVMERGRR